MFIHVHTLALGMPCAFLSDSTGVMVVSLGNGLEENARVVISCYPGGTIHLAPGNWSIWGGCGRGMNRL